MSFADIFYAFHDAASTAEQTIAAWAALHAMEPAQVDAFYAYEHAALNH